jgi:RNA polymerase sigma-70 factor (ECF subfamily)
MELADAYIKFNKSLYAFILSKINNREDAEDILHNVFVKMATNIGSLSDKEKMQNWLYRITRNTIIDYYRVKGKRQKPVEFKEKFAVENEVTEDTTKGLDKCLLDFVHQLPEEYKAVIIDSEINGIAQKDLAIKYNVPYPTLRSKVQRGRERLRKMLIQCCVIESDNRGNILESKRREDCGAPCDQCE